MELPPGTASYSDRSPPPRKRQVLLLLGIFAAIGVVLLGMFGALLEGLVWLIPPQVEQQLGALIVPVYERMATPSLAQDTLNQLLDRLESQLPPEQRPSRDQPSRDYKVLLIRQDTVNALAIPGDRVILYQGLIQQMQSENELMMVMGHELGHFAHRDHLRGLGRGLLTQLVLATFFGDVGSLSSIAISGVTAVSNASFSQSQEFQADEFGLKLLNTHYGNVAGATDFFQRISRELEENIDFLATHPNPERRVQRLKQLTANQGYQEGTRSPLPPPLQAL